MSRATVMRLLRIKHGITARELAEAAGVSQQFISDLEFGKYFGRYECAASAESLVRKAFEAVAENRAQQVCGLLADLSENRSHLLDIKEEKEVEL